MPYYLKQQHGSTKESFDDVLTFVERALEKPLGLLRRLIVMKLLATWRSSPSLSAVLAPTLGPSRLRVVC